MRTKKKKAEIFVDESEVRPEARARVDSRSEATEPEEKANGKTKERFAISFDLNEDGSPDLDGMRGRTKERVQSFFNDPRVAAAFGSKPITPEVEVQIFHPAVISGIYDVVGAVEIWGVQKWMKVPPPIAKQVFTYSPKEKEALTGPTVRVLNKYAADWMKKYQDEIALVSLLSALFITKLNAAAMLIQMQRTSTVQPASQEENTPPGYEKVGVDPGVKTN